MIKLDPNSNFIIQITQTAQSQTTNNTQSPYQRLPLTSIKNIDTILSKQTNTQYSASIPTLDEKLNLYKEYLHYGNNPKDCHSLLLELETLLSHQEIKNTQYTEIFKTLLPLLKLMADTFLTPKIRRTLTKSQLAKINQREEVIRKIIMSAYLLPNILFSTDNLRIQANINSVKDSLMSELIQSTFHRLVKNKIQSTGKTDIQAFLLSPPPSLQKKLEQFITTSQTELLKPIRKALNDNIKQLKNTVIAANDFLNKSLTLSCSDFPNSTDLTYAIYKVSKEIERLINILEERSHHLAETQKIDTKQPTQLSQNREKLSTSTAKVIQVLRGSIDQTEKKLMTFHSNINREYLKFFTAETLKPFLSLSESDRTRCLILKKTAAPLQQNARKLQQTTAQLREAIHKIEQAKISPTSLPHTIEEALCIELSLLTEATPQGQLLQAIEAAHQVAQHILTLPFSLITTSTESASWDMTVYRKFLRIIQDYSDRLREMAFKLRETTQQAQHNALQKNVLFTVNYIEKTSIDIQNVLMNAIESFSGAMTKSNYNWLRKFDIDIQNNWNGITGLINKKHKHYLHPKHLSGQTTQHHQIHLATFPLLHEIEKLLGICRKLEMTVTLLIKENAQTNNEADNMLEKIRSTDLTNIIRLKKTIRNVFAEKNLQDIKLYYHHNYYDGGRSLISLDDLLQKQAHHLLQVGRALHETAWLASWDPNDLQVQQTLRYSKKNLQYIKNSTKDAIEVTTGIRLHSNSPEGMIAKDAGEWLAEIKKTWIEKPNQPISSQQLNNKIATLINQLCHEFTTEHDPDGALFRLRIILAMRDAEQGTLSWAITPQEYLAMTKTRKAYTLAWAEKRLTYSMLYNCLIYYTLMPMFSLRSAKNTLVSPLRFLNLLLTPARMAVTRQAMQKVRPGNPHSSDLITQYDNRETYQTVWRFVSMITPQLVKTVAATGITFYGLIKEREYRNAFLGRTVSRLPGDLFWISSFAIGQHTITAFNAAKWKQHTTLTAEQPTVLQTILNLSASDEKNIDPAQPAVSKHKRHARTFTNKIEDENSKKIWNIDDTLQKNWINASSKDREIDTQPDKKSTLNNIMQMQMDKNLAFIQSYYSHKEPQKSHTDKTSSDWWWDETEGKTFWIEEYTNDPTKIILKNSTGNKTINVIQINNRWYLNDWEPQKAYLYATLNGLSALPEPHQKRLETILYRIFKTNPDTTPELAIKIANTVLSILLFQNIYNQSYVTDLFEIKYFLILALPDKTNGFIDATQRDIAHKLNIPINLEALAENNSLLAPIAIDTKKYEAAFIKYHREPPKGAFENLDNNDLYYKGISACIQFLRSGLINEKSNQWMFNKTQRYFTQQQLRLLNKTAITQEDNNKLIWLNIAKYHLYTLFKAHQNVTNKQNDATFPEIKLEKREDHDTTSSQYITPRLLEISRRWEDSSAIPWKEEGQGIEGNIYSISNQKYICLRGMLWRIFEFSENHIAILVVKKDGKNDVFEALRFNKIWDIAPAETYPTPNPLDLKLMTIKSYFQNNELPKPTPETTSLQWWLDTAWKNTELNISKQANLEFNNTIVIVGNKKYLHLYPYYWEYENKEGNSTIGTLKNRLGTTLNISFNDGRWYLNDWDQQRAYFASALIGLNLLLQESPSMLEDIIKRIFKINPETPPEHVVKIANTALSVLLFQHIHDKLYVNEILQIKYLLMSSIFDATEQFINTDHMSILHNLNIPIDLEALKENLSQLYPTEIDNKKYTTALKSYYLTSSATNSYNMDNYDPYYMGITYCDSLISKLNNENNQLTFNKILFDLTKKELTLTSKNSITVQDKQKLSWLNIAKYHLYTASKYSTLYESVTEYTANTPFGTGTTLFSVLEKSKIDAVKIYYLNQENLDPSHITLSEEEILREYSNIIRLRNEASERLEMITAALFYQAMHPQEKFGGFDFIKAEVYYQQQMEQCTKELYMFDATPPPNFTSYENFKPYKDFSSRNDYTKQFNDYVDNGSSDYESKLLTPLLLEQLDIGLKDLSLPPKRWFTLQLYCYDYPQNHLGWSIHNTSVWPEKLNVIQLHSGDYLTISEINGNMKTNIISEEFYNSSIKQENKKENTYFYTKSDNVFLNMLIGAIPPTTNESIQRNCELKYCGENNVPARVKTAVQQALHASLNALAGYQKETLETITFTQTMLEIFVPFYKEFYHALTDSKYTTDKTSLLIDSIFVAPILRSTGISLRSLGKAESTGVINIIKQGIKKGLSRTTLAEFVAPKIPKIYLSREASSAKNELENLIASTSTKISPVDIIRKGSDVVEIPRTQIKFPSSAQIKYPVLLKEAGEFGHYKGIYTVFPVQTDDEARYFIKNGKEIYQVYWDDNKYTWRLVESERPMGTLYGMPIQYLGSDKWEYNTTLRLRGAGIETQEVITETKEIASDYNTSRNLAKIDTRNSSKDIFTSENILKDGVVISDLTDAIKKAQETAIEMINNAKNMLSDKKFIFRTKELIRIFTNRRDEQNFLIMLRRLKHALKNLNVKKDIKLVNVEDSNLFAQISPHHYSAEEGQYLSINYSAYQKNKELIFTKQVTKEEKEYYANQNFARTLIHEFTHAKSVAGSTDSAGYIKLLQLNGKHDVTKLLIKAKLGLPEVKNNADSLTEIILILDNANSYEFFLNEFLELYQKWEINIEKRINELNEKIRSIVTSKTQISWTSTEKSEILRLKEAFNVEMCQQLISGIDESIVFSFDLDPSFER